MGGQYSFSATSYAGHEEEILRTRNRNRPAPQTREHLDWRYLGEPTQTPPMVFWLRDNQGEPIAMASLIFRPYVVDGKKEYFAVLGDLSVNEEHRGEGLSKTLLHFVNTQIEKQRIPCAFVMPNKAAERAVISAGWTRIGGLASGVCLINPSNKLKKILKVNWLAATLSFGSRALTRLFIAFVKRKDVLLRSISQFDQDFQRFWDNFPKESIVMRDRGFTSLSWRYKQPGMNYSIGKFVQDDKMIGYIVSDISETEGMCLISDFLVSDPALIRACMALFLEESLRNRKIFTVRIAFVENHDYANHLLKLGFFLREAETAFLIYHPRSEILKDAGRWFITPGDKDA